MLAELGGWLLVSETCGGGIYPKDVVADGARTKVHLLLCKCIEKRQACEKPDWPDASAVCCITFFNCGFAHEPLSSALSLPLYRSLPLSLSLSLSLAVFLFSLRH